MSLSRITPSVGLIGLAVALSVTGARAQQRPDSGTGIQSAPRQSLEGLPKGAAPDQVQAPQRPKAHMGPVVKFVPAGFKFSGNSLVSSAELLALEKVASAIGKETDFGGLADLADQIRLHYVQKGYILTDVYFPQQKFDARGGVVEFVVVEARVGKVSVSRSGDAGITAAQAQALADNFLPRGTLIDQALLDKPVLLLRDMVGTDASATVKPGAGVGEADIVIEVKGRGKAYEASALVDNLGSAASGKARGVLQASLDRPLGVGDQLQVRLQGSDMADNYLYRVGYSLPVGPYATKLLASVSRNVYALGGEFRELDASGFAKVTSGSIVQPVLRGRYATLMLIAGLDRKQLFDRTGASDPSSETIDSGRLGVLGSFSDTAGRGGNTTFSLLMTEGKSSFAASDTVLNSKGRFSKVNLDLQRTEFFSPQWSAVFSLSSQFASKNLRNPERISYGGPQAVRGYAGPSGTGDEGILGSAEFRYLLPTQLLGTPLTATGFYDAASVKFRANPIAGLTRTRAVFDAFGLGLRAGREGAFVASAQVAKALRKPEGGIDQTVTVVDSDPRYWLSLQFWF